MNEFTVKKIAEVYAFCQLAETILTRSGASFTSYAPEVQAQLTTFSTIIYPSLVSTSQDIFDQKVAKTITKLTTMMELYIGDEWDNPVEVLEWLSFYAGAGSAHAELAWNAGAAQGQDTLAISIKETSEAFSHLLSSITTRLGQTGLDRGRV